MRITELIHLIWVNEVEEDEVVMVSAEDKVVDVEEAEIKYIWWCNDNFKRIIAAETNRAAIIISVYLREKYHAASLNLDACANLVPLYLRCALFVA